MGIMVMQRFQDAAVLGIDIMRADIKGFLISGKNSPDANYTPLPTIASTIGNVDQSYVGPNNFNYKYPGKVSVYLAMDELGATANEFPYYIQLSVVTSTGVVTPTDETIIYPYGVNSRSVIDLQEKVAQLYGWSESDQKWHKISTLVDPTSGLAYFGTQDRDNANMDVYNIPVTPGDAVSFVFPQTLNSIVVHPDVDVYIHFSLPAQNDVDTNPSWPIPGGSPFSMDKFKITQISIKLPSTATQSTTVPVLGVW